MFKSLLSTAPLAGALDWGSLLLRISFGFMMAYNHGYTKFQTFPADGPGFPDPLGIGGTASMAGTVFAELLCAILIGFGLLTRLSAIPLIFTMLIAAIKMHENDPFDVKEHALMFVFGYFVIFLLGPGKYSLDALIFRKKEA